MTAPRSRAALWVLAAVWLLPAAVGATPHDLAPPIVGEVVDSAGQPLSNVLVLVSGTRRSAISGADGTFIIRAVPPGEYHLDATLIGYAPGHAEVAVPTEGDEVRTRIVLSPSPLSLEGIVVTGTPGASDPLTITQSTTQVSGKELDRGLGATVAASLADEPGISVRYSGPAASVPVIRGLTGERVLVLENGQRTGDLSGSSADHAVSIDPLAATRIEVVRGPASLLYGNSALGGVVNVIGTDIPTNVPTGPEGYLAAQSESATPGGAATAELTVPLGPSLAISVRGGFRDAGDARVGGGGTLENSSLTNFHGAAGLGYVAERISGGLSVGGHDFRYGLPFGHAGEEEAPEAVEEEGGVTIEGSRYEVSGRSDLLLGGSVLGDLNVQGSAQWYTHDEIEPDGAVGTTFKLGTQTLDLRVSTRLGDVRGTVGASGLLKQYEPVGEEALTPPADSRSAGVFFYQEVPIGGREHFTEHAPHLQVGARYDLYRIETGAGEERFGAARSRDFGAVSGSLGVSVPLASGASLSGSLARAFRAPSVEELFSNAFHAAAGSYDVGNPELAAETNVGVEGMVRAQSSRLTLQFSAYYNRIDDFIAPIILGDTTIVAEGGGELTVPLTRFGQENAMLRGVEGKAEMVFAREFVLGVRGDVVEGEFADGEPLPFMPAGHLGGGARWDNGKLGVGADLEHAFGQGDVPANELATDPYTLVGLSATYTRTLGGRVHAVTLRAENLLDEEYREATSRIKEFAPNPGRNLSLVYRVIF